MGLVSLVTAGRGWHSPVLDQGATACVDEVSSWLHEFQGVLRITKQDRVVAAAPAPC